MSAGGGVVMNGRGLTLECCDLTYLFVAERGKMSARCRRRGHFSLGMSGSTETRRP
jgi:hypothetical protein